MSGNRIGVNNPNARFTQEEIQEILFLLQTHSQTSVARLKDCSPVTIHRIKHQQSYAPENSSNSNGISKLRERQRLRKEDYRINDLVAYWVGC
jgi:hypothetical protein